MRSRSWHVGLALLMALAMGLGWARAATPVVPVPAAALHALSQTLQDPTARTALIDEINALLSVRAQTAPPPAGLAERVSAQAARLGGTLTHIARLAPVAALEAWGRQLAGNAALRRQWLAGAGVSGGVVVLAGLMGWLARRLLAPAARRLGALASAPPWRRTLAGLGAALISLAPPLVLLAAGLGALAVAPTILPVAAAADALGRAVVEAAALAGGIGALAGALLLGGPGGGRFLPLDEASADYALVWVQRLSRFGVYGWFGLTFAGRAGLDADLGAALQRAYGLALAGLAAMLILQNRKPVARRIRGAGGGGWLGQARAGAAGIWHIAAIAYLLGVYGVWAASVPGGFSFLARATLGSVLVLALARGADGGGSFLAARFFTVSPALELRLPGLQARANLYAPLMTDAGRVLIYALAALMVAQAWGLDALALLATPGGERLVGAVATIGLSAGAAVLVWELANLLVTFSLSRPGEDGVSLEQTARVRTLLPLARKMLAIVLGLGVGLVALATLGINIGPLLAGAGIAGIAVGFGAQSLVKDVITGMFILMQDAVAVGDVVSVAGSSGLVEQITIRSIRLRDMSGTVIIIPFSEVTTVQNMTKEFSYALFSIGVAYREDVDEVMGVIAALGAELRETPEFAPLILAPIEIFGLDQFADSAIIIKARIKTKPIQQWTVMREFNRRMKRRFDELGIDIPFPHQTIYFGTDKQGKAPSAHVEALVALAGQGAP
ncbi:mechanosensitive ion channel family protein [Acidocella sp.]|uniref:mechanosensitive ion channel family protein n=1 Tax=Acidocella sp. TaxID=50710 RepID=UPI0026092CFC|nr:mechanosensitive ion channel domain-containing protein [Acidocella sp.]